MERPPLGPRIRAARLAAGLTQQALAQQLGLGYGLSVSRWERGANEPDLATLRRLAAALSVTAGSLVD